MDNKQQHTNAFLMHISSFAGYFFPLGSIITPLILWQTQKDKSDFLDAHGKEAVNFNISFSLYIFIVSASFFTLIFGNLFKAFRNFDSVDFGYSNFEYHFNLDGDVITFFGISSIVGILALIKIALIIIAALKANKGENYHYPFTIKFIK